MVAYYANEAGLTGVSGQLMAAAEALSALSTTPPAHPALAADETSTSAAARLSEHGAVMASRAADGAQVLLAAARAVGEITRVSGEMDTENAAALTAARRGPTGGVAPVFTPAVTANVVAPDVPIVAAPARYGKFSAQIMENGQSSAGSPFSAACARFGAAFNQSAVATRSAADTVEAESLRGNTAPVLASALRGFATWADSMEQHSSTVAAAASGHSERFGTAQQDTPRTAEFSSKERELSNAQMLNARYPGVYTGVLTKLQAELTSLNTQAGVASATYHVGELPAAPPPPPPVVPVVAPAAGQPAGGSPQASAEPQRESEQAAATSGDASDPGTDLGIDDGLAAEPADLVADPALTGQPQSDPMSQAGPLVGMLPGVLAGAVGGLLGAATSVPAALAQQAQSAISQATQAASGLASGLSTPETPELDTSGLGGGEPLGVGDIGGGGGGGSTEPAGVSSDLPPVSGGMLAQAGPPSPPPTLSGPSIAAASSQPAGMGPGMMPMMPPMAGGMGSGGGGSRPIREPDKKVLLPVEPNGEFVTGEVPRRPVAEADDVTNDHRAAARTADADVAVVTSSRRRRVDLPKDDE
ncbi:hypothetical protein MASS_1p0041 (plasmid) [Mycobacteroides abscessus subsp. bolletii 50594]|uniref:PPE family protein n=1 Tax=Mycobacteroides abscessus subsp. bolletii 50594 TaxID=1303024 RepID=A0AB33AJ62_9MYCO|nr:hypothetical protein [Mycobacteroides abscessus]AGM31601.1 hypothetical protein MASS_1p0041 [Mycobacteroides abscessus subsp. bolletii 50594]